MPVRRTISALLAASILASGLVHAQDRRDDRRDHRPPSRDARDERGAGPEHRFHRGERLPVEYRHHNYVVNDWRAHRLAPPPRGDQWVQLGADYALVAIATGVILSTVLAN